MTSRRIYPATFKICLLLRLYNMKVKSPNFLRSAAASIIVVIVAISAAFTLIPTFSTFDKVTATFEALGYFFILFIFGVVAVSYIVRSFRYFFLNSSLDVHLPILRSIEFYIAGFAFTLTPGRLGELARIWFIQRKFDYPTERLIPPVVMDRVGDLCAALLLCALTIFQFLDQVVFLLIFAAFILFCISLLCLDFFSNWLFRFSMYLFPARARLIVKARKFIILFRRFFSIRIFFPLLILSVIAWFLEALVLFFIGMELHPGFSFTSTVFIFSFSTLVGLLTFIPGGIGGTEATMVTLMTLEGIPIEVALTTTILVRVSTLWFGFALGLITATSLVVRR